MYNECISPSSSARSTRVVSVHKMRSPMCCLGANNAVVEPEAMMIPNRSSQRSPYDWFKSTAHELDIIDRCRRMKTRVKVTCRNNDCAYNCCSHQQHHSHQRHQSYPGDFSYDALSYALNFEDDVKADDDDSLPSFTARLPASPVTKSRSATVDLISF
ncbi:unnamed protein product [Cochlearia groenlandica]